MPQALYPPARSTPPSATTSGHCLPPLDIYRNVLAWLKVLRGGGYLITIVVVLVCR
jgi:hypothetical protein